MTRQITIDKNETEGFAARIRNRGQSNGTQTVELYKDGVLVTDQANLTLTPDETAYVLEAPSVFSDASIWQTLTMEVVTDNMTRTIEVYLRGIPETSVGDLDSFERSSPLDDYVLDTNLATVNTGYSTDGSKSVNLDAGGSGTPDDADESVILRDTPDNVPSRGYEMKYDFVYRGTSASQSFIFCAQELNLDNYYAVKTDNNQNIKIYVVEGGSVVNEKTGSADSGSYSPDTTYTATVQITSTGITYTDNNGGTSQISLADERFDTGFFGVASGVSQSVDFDYLRVSSEI